MKWISFAITCFFTSAAMAGPTLAMTTFTAGDPISAAAVNGNFSVLATAFQNSNAGLYVFPLSAGTTGQVLSVGSTSLVWTTPAAASGNSFLQQGNAFGTVAKLGTTDSQPLDFMTVGSTRMTIGTDGHIGVGTTPSVARFHVNDGGTNIAVNSTVLLAEGNLDGNNVLQYGVVIKPKVNQLGNNGGYIGLAVDAVVSNGPGKNKLVDLKVNGQTKFAVDDKGYFSATGFMGAFPTLAQINCDNVSTGFTPILFNTMNFDFGAISTSNYAIPISGVYEIILDAPYSQSGSPMVFVDLSEDNGTSWAPLNSGKTIKRFTTGNILALKVGCSSVMTATTNNVTFSTAKSVFGIRKIH